MKPWVLSLVTSLLVAVVVLAFTTGVLAPRLPRVVGPPAVTETRRFVWPKADKVQVRNADGSIEVRTHDRESVLATVEIRVFAVTPAADALAKEYAGSLVAVTAEDAVLEVLTEAEERPDDVDVIVDYALLVPEGTHVDVSNTNGNVWISKGCADVRVQGRNTDIEIGKATGKVVAETTNGRIRVLDLAADTDLETVNGNVYAHMLGGALQAVTTNGSIVAHVIRPEVESCALTARNGGITLVLSAGCSARVEARTALGVVRSDFPVDTSDGTKRSRQLTGSIGEGRTRLTMDTLNGNIWITRSRT